MLDHLGSVAISSTTTRLPVYVDVPQEPILGPFIRPSITLQYSCGKLGALPCLRIFPSSSIIEQRIPVCRPS